MAVGDPDSSSLSQSPKTQTARQLATNSPTHTFKPVGVIPYHNMGVETVYEARNIIISIAIIIVIITIIIIIIIITIIIIIIIVYYDLLLLLLLLL